MSGLINVEGKFFRFLERMANCVFLSCLWSLFSLPVITIGASTSALYYAMHKVVKLESGHLFKTFWKGFRDNFKKGTILWGILLLVYAFIGVDLYVSYVLSGADSFLSWVTVLLIVVAVVLTFWSLHWFPYIAHVEDSIKAILRNTLIMCIQNFGKAFVLFLLYALCIAILVFLPIAPVYLLILPSGYMYFAHSLHIKIFSRYFEIKNSSDHVMHDADT